MLAGNGFTSQEEVFEIARQKDNACVCLELDKKVHRFDEGIFGRSACVSASACLHYRCLHYRQTYTLWIITNRCPSFYTCYIQNVLEVPVQNQRMLDIPHICEIQ
jgi:hypothetical protein